MGRGVGSRWISEPRRISEPGWVGEVEVDVECLECLVRGFVAG